MSVNLIAMMKHMVKVCLPIKKVGDMRARLATVKYLVAAFTSTSAVEQFFALAR